MLTSLAIITASYTVKAQQLTIDLVPGWNYISYPFPEAVGLDSFLSSITPTNGDIIKSFGTSSLYVNGRWRGGITSLNPGEGYHYYSNNPNIVTIVLDNPFVPVEPLIVTTNEPADITASSATVSGEVELLDGSFVLLRGVCWGTQPNPGIEGDYTSDGTGIGNYTTALYNLNANTLYYIRAYAVSEKGMAYGENISFTTLEGYVAPTGAIDGLFSVSDTQQVYFSQGNLQYIGSADTPYWKFADNQWDYLGSFSGQSSANQNVDRDLFGWGTSGYHDTNDTLNVNYQPWSTSISTVNATYNEYGYGPSTNMTDPDLTGTSANYDWGVYNPISNGGNINDMWRTLTVYEWDYVFNTRNTTSGIRYAKAQVNEVNGVVILPDNWDADTYSLNIVNTSGANYLSNVISEEQWPILEDAGAVFLPAAGYRHGTSVGNSSGSYGRYWSSSYYNSGSAHYLRFYDSSLTVGPYLVRNDGFSVRLVCPAN